MFIAFFSYRETIITFSKDLRTPCLSRSFWILNAILCRAPLVTFWKSQMKNDKMVWEAMSWGYSEQFLQALNKPNHHLFQYRQAGKGKTSYQLYNAWVAQYNHRVDCLISCLIESWCIIKFEGYRNHTLKAGKVTKQMETPEILDVAPWVSSSPHRSSERIGMHIYEDGGSLTTQEHLQHKGQIS